MIVFCRPEWIKKGGRCCVTFRGTSKGIPYCTYLERVQDRETRCESKVREDGRCNAMVQKIPADASKEKARGRRIAFSC